MTGTVLGVESSLSGQHWRWRGRGFDASDPDFRPDTLVDQLLLARGCARDDLERMRNPSLRAFMPDPAIFRDMEAAARRIADALERDEKIVVFGDYDVDGATSAALMIRLFRMLGADAGHYIPDRLLEGYGPGGDALVELKRSGADLVITVDCGAQAFEALGMAADAMLDVIVVDHHKCSSDLPIALALVNPNRLDECDDAASHGHLAAVGVAFLLAAQLVRELRGRDFFDDRGEPDLLSLLDIVALGTVADVAALTGLNRAFVTQGLKVMRRRANVGLDALITASRLKRAVECSDLGFALGPRINAGGRVGEADLGVRLLTTEDAEEARGIAAQLDRLNEERRAIEMAVTEAAMASCDGQSNASVAIVSGKGWHPGVIGIVASRMKEKLGKPAIVIALDEHGVGKGSGRSISGADLGAAVIAAKDSGLLVAGGGHAMAAGLTVEEAKIEALAAFLNDRLAEDVSRAGNDKALTIDAVLAPAGVNPDMVAALDSGGPYGMGWPGPRIVAGPVRIVRCDIVGADHVRCIFAGDDGRSIKGIAFRAAESALGQTLLNAPRDRRFWVAGRAKIDDWGARPAAELILDDAAWAD